MEPAGEVATERIICRVRCVYAWEGGAVGGTRRGRSDGHSPVRRSASTTLAIDRETSKLGRHRCARARCSKPPHGANGA